MSKTETVKVDTVKSTAIKTAQSNSKSKSQLDKVEVTFKKDTSYHKKGEKKKVHPSVAEIFKAKGIV